MSDFRLDHERMNRQTGLPAAEVLRRMEALASREAVNCFVVSWRVWYNLFGIYPMCDVLEHADELPGSKEAKVGAVSAIYGVEVAVGGYEWNEVLEHGEVLRRFWGAENVACFW